MRRNVAGAVALLVAGLACSACGTASKNDSANAAATITTARSTVTLWVPVTQRVARASGAGSKTIGPFGFRGELSMTVSCTGTGSLNLEIVSSPSMPGLGTNCPETGSGIGPPPTDIGHGPTTGSGHRDRRAQIKVDASAHVHWTITVRETYMKPSIVPAGLQQLPLRRSGVGPESLGTFAMTTHGSLYFAATCVGKGTFGLWFNRPELGISSACPNSRQKAIKSVSSGVSEHRARIDISAPAGMKWTVIVFEGPRPSGRPDDPTNVWR